MITINNEVTTVEFAKEKNGVISIAVNGTTLSLKQLVKEVELGKSYTQEEGSEKPLPSVEMEFFKEESIDAMIECLKKLKYNLQYPYGCLALAC